MPLNSISTARLQISRLTAEELLSFSSPLSMLTVDPTYRLAEGLPTERTMHACATAMKEWPSAVAGLWVMVSTNDAVVIGDCLIFGGVEVDGQFAIAYEVAESRWNQGFGKERLFLWLSG